MAAKRRPPLTVLVLAAGQGKRLRSKTIKLLHPVAGVPMLARVLEAAQQLKPRQVITVVGHQADAVKASLEGMGTEFALQKQRLGTGHAVLQAASALGKAGGTGTLLILNGDLPTLQAATLRKFVNRHERAQASLTILTTELDDPSGYGHVIRDSRGAVQRVVEHGDATREEKTIREVNCGLYCADAKKLLATLKRIKPNNVQGEYYLTDAVHHFLERGEKVMASVHTESEELLGVNTRQELSAATQTIYARSAERVQDRGVTLIDAQRTLIDPRAKIGRDTVIYPDVIIDGPCVIGEDCVIGPGSHLTNVNLGRGVEVRDHCVLVDCRAGHNVRIGPFAHLRPGADVAEDAHIGNFVELKKTKLGRGSKASHLAYLGDANIGPGTNIGAGTITCNYDGKNKHQTVLGKGVFIGSNTQIVAPVTVRDGAYVAAGSTVTQDVPAGALAIARSKQRNLEGWSRRRKAAKKSQPRKRKPAKTR